jgi:hypothetical protein
MFLILTNTLFVYGMKDEVPFDNHSPGSAGAFSCTRKTMFAPAPNQPSPAATPPADPCLECFKHGSHEMTSRGPGVHTCDPIMAGIGTWLRQKEAARQAEIAALKARARQLLDEKKSV